MTEAPPPARGAVGDFFWRDGDRTIVFRRRALATVVDVLAEQSWAGFELLSTFRGLDTAPAELPETAAQVHYVPHGPVADAAAYLLDVVRGQRLVALGGGRVVDTAKAIAAVRGGEVCAVPTTLSGAEMTWFHRLPKGHEDRPHHRPVLVIADPLAMTTQPEVQLRASAMNALAHGAEALYTPLANPVSTLAALRGARLIGEGLDAGAAEEGSRAAVALGSLLCAYAVGSALFAVHHVLCQTIVRVCGTPHAETNAAVLPHVLAAMRARAPEAMASLAQALDTEPAALPERVASLGGGPRRLSELISDRAALTAAVDAAVERPEIHLTPDPPDREELLALVDAAW